LTKFDISKNNLRRVGTKALAEGLKSNQIMTELNISSNCMGSEGAIALADVIPGMGALTKLTFGDKQVTMTTEMTEANFRMKLKSYEAQIVAAFLPKCT
jgi:Ran GTPase-activating protein (RanGAP) involved in mRNA processing and transport